MTTRYIDATVVINFANRAESFYMEDGCQFPYFGKKDFIRKHCLLLDEEVRFHSIERIYADGNTAIYDVRLAYEQDPRDLVYELEDEMDAIRQRLDNLRVVATSRATTLGDLSALEELKRQLEEQA